MVARQKELIEGNLKGELLPMSFPCDNAEGKDGLITRDAAFVYTADLPQLITSYLDSHEMYGKYRAD